MVDYSPDIAQEIILRVSEGEVITNICKDEHIPNHRDVYRWMRENANFATEYERARVLRADARFERLEGYKTQLVSGKITSDVARVLIDVEKWQAGKESPRYSDKQTIDMNIKDDTDALNRARARLAVVKTPGND